MIQIKYLVITIGFILITSIKMQEQQQNFQQSYSYQQNQQEQFFKELSIKKTACLLLSRLHANANKQLIDQIIEVLQPNEVSAYVNKMYAVAIERCLPMISHDEALQFFTEKQNLDPTIMFYILDDMNYPGIANQMHNLTTHQKQIIKFIKQFDEQMMMKKEQEEAQSYQDKESDNYNFGIFGIEMGSMNNVIVYIYIVAIGGVLIAAFIWGFNQLNNSSMPIKKKNKKNKKQK